VGRKLKKYDEYLEKLLTYAQACEIEVIYTEVEGDGQYVPTQRKITIDESLEDSTEIATLMHELGHSTDDALKDPKKLKKIDKAYKAFYSGESTEKQKKLVLECEEKAWFYGRGIARKLRIPLGKWYDLEQTEALKDYGEEARTQ
jgi:hypothetical protein